MFNTSSPILFRSMFNLTVSVSDGVANDTAYVEVTVTDNNDLYPVFQGVDRFTVEEEGPPQLVATLNVTDGDQFPNNVVSTWASGLGYLSDLTIGRRKFETKSSDSIVIFPRVALAHKFVSHRKPINNHY